ncbi:hypothetical protein CK220_28685 [Mesorhizobium sp. WSM3860]|nr:hypothetical protein CK220_28685 [Mesorhizobium sp. WSM3860]
MAIFFRLSGESGSAIAAQKDTQMKYLQRMNENPSSWLLLATFVAVVAYLGYLAGTGMTW